MNEKHLLWIDILWVGAFVLAVVGLIYLMTASKFQGASSPPKERQVSTWVRPAHLNGRLPHALVSVAA